MSFPNTSALEAGAAAAANPDPPDPIMPGAGIIPARSRSRSSLLTSLAIAAKLGLCPESMEALTRRVNSLCLSINWSLRPTALKPASERSFLRGLSFIM